MKRFRNYGLFVGTGIGYMLVPEYTNIVIVNHSLRNYIGAMVIYVILLSLGYAVSRRLSSERHPVRSNLKYMLLFGFLGLVFEWTFCGHPPGSDAIQWGMFVYWVGLYMIPRIMSDGREIMQPLRRSILRTYIVYSVIHLAMSLLIPVRYVPYFIPLLWTAVYTGFILFYIRYIHLSRISPPAALQPGG